MAATVKNRWRGVPDAALGAIVAHPVRCRLMAIFADRVASPNEIAQELGMPVGDVSYHVRTLKDAGMIELVEERPVRGSTEHFYRAMTKDIVVTDEDYKNLSIEERVAFARLTFQVATAEASYSLETRKFGERHNHHIGRMPFSVDERAWNELSELHREMLDRIIEICGESDVRLAGSEEPRISGVAFAALFEMPPRERIEESD
jgi:DNA-binding transcriptional ArsR family regulator